MVKQETITQMIDIYILELKIHIRPVRYKQQMILMLEKISMFQEIKLLEGN